MNKKGNMYVWKIYIYIANPRTFTNHTLPLLIQSRKINYYVDTITAVLGCQRLVCFSVYRVSEFFINKLRILPFIWHWEQLWTQQPSWPFENQTPRDNLSSDICRVLLNSTRSSNRGLAEVVVLWVCSVVSLYAIKYPTLRPVF